MKYRAVSTDSDYEFRFFTEDIELKVVDKRCVEFWRGSERIAAQYHGCSDGSLTAEPEGKDCVKITFAWFYDIKSLEHLVLQLGIQPGWDTQLSFF